MSVYFLGIFSQNKSHFFHFTPPPHSIFCVSALLYFRVFVFSCFFCRYGRSMNKKSFSCLFFLKNLRGIVRKSKVRKSANSDVKESSSRATKADSSSKILSQITKASFFSATAPNDRGYGHLAVCGSIRCRETTR
jgi:hypothetical protein